MSGDDQCAFVNVNVKQLGTVYVEVGFEDVILNHVPWSLHQCITKTQLYRKPGGHPAKFMWPLGRLPTKICNIVTGAKSAKQNGGSHIWVIFQVQQAMARNPSLQNHLWQNLDYKKSILAKPSWPPFLPQTKDLQQKPRQGWEVKG